VVSHRSESRVVDGVWVQEVGDGPLVALVHGTMDRSGGMLRVHRILQSRCRVLRYDRRGYGRSLAAGPPTSFDQQVDDLAALLDGRPAVLAGHSLGGVVCLTLAQRQPDLVRAVLAYEAPKMWAPWWPGGTAGSRALASMRSGGDGHDGDGHGAPDDDERARDAAESFLRRMIGDATWERLPAAMRAERRAEGPTLIAEMRSVRPPHPAPFDPAAITVPVVAAFGTETRPHHMRATEELARAAPHGELRTIEGAGHGAHLTHPAEVADLVHRALELAGERV
jgi:pimeloyl-ACP methyl ester carboxylesterase